MTNNAEISFPYELHEIKKEKVQKPAGRPSTLTPEIAIELRTLWELSGPNSLSDKEIAGRMGITQKTLDGWLSRNQEVEILLDGRLQMVGLRGIRTRARAMIKAAYLARLNRLADKAENLDDFKTAATIVQWLMEKQFPKFGQVPESSTEGPKLIKTPGLIPADAVEKQKKNL